MTDNELTHAAATEVMGWHKGYGSTPNDAPIWLDTDNKYVGFYIDCKSPYATGWKKKIKRLMWTPLTDMNHLWMVVEKVVAMEVKFYLCFWQGQDHKFYQYCD